MVPSVLQPSPAPSSPSPPAPSPLCRDVDPHSYEEKKKKKELAELSSAYFTCREYNSGATTACYLPVFLGSTNSRKLSFTLGKYPSTRMHTPHVTTRLNSRGARALLLYLFPDSSVLFLPIGFQFQNTFDTTSRKTGRSPYRSTTTEK